KKKILSTQQFRSVLCVQYYVCVMCVLHCKQPEQQIKPYLKHHLPKRYHYASNRRIEDVSVLVNPRWLFERYHTHTHTLMLCRLAHVLMVLNHLLRMSVYSPSHPTEQSGPEQCPITSLEPTHTLGCSCTALSERRHMLFGRPRVLQSDAKYCVLHQHGFITAYSTLTHTPVWSSFTLDKTAESSPVISDCLRADIRIPANQSATCEQFNNAGNITHVFLFPPSECVCACVLNLLQLVYFQEVLLLKYTSQYNGINVVTGPVYDYNFDGRFDSPEQIQEFVAGSSIPVPTHYFVVLTSCKNDTQTVSECSAELQTVSFLLPHRSDNMESCAVSPESQWAEPLLWMHQSRVRDVEWISGLDFFQDSKRPIAELLRLKTRPTAAIHPKA
uniref:Uncharacterized protein n=1 Tax=Sinocyclocheilus grahami TaxID=75366 RepID=A0A672L713_SINGR